MEAAQRVQYERQGDHSKSKTIHRKQHDVCVCGPVVINCISRGTSNLAERARHTTVKNWPPELEYLKQEVSTQRRLKCGATEVVDGR